MLFEKKNAHVVDTEETTTPKEINMVKLGFTIAGGVAATVAGVYVGKKLYQTYCNPLLDEEVDCNNLPEEPLKSEGTNEMSTETNVINFSEVEEEVNTNQENELSVRHTLKDIFGPIEVRMSAFDARDDFKELFSIAERGFQDLQAWRHLNVLNDTEKEYVGKIKEIIKTYVATMFDYFEEQKRTDIIKTINDLKTIVDDYTFCTPLIVSFENGYDKFFDVTRVDESGVHYFISDMASDIQQTVQKFVESYPKVTHIYQALPSSGKILDTIKRLNDGFLTIKEDSFKKIHPISDLDIRYLNDISWSFSDYLENNFGVITNEVRDYLKSEKCICFSEAYIKDILDNSLRREILYMNPDTCLLFYFNQVKCIDRTDLSTFRFDIANIIRDLDTFVKEVRIKNNDINWNENDFIEDFVDEDHIDKIIWYIKAYSNLTLEYDKGSDERNCEIDMLSSICKVCDDTTIVIVPNELKDRIKSYSMTMIDRLNNTDPKIFQCIRELMDLDVMNDICIPADQMMNAIDSVFDTWDSVSKRIKESMDLVTDDDIADVQKLKHQYRLGICNTIEELYDRRDHLYQINADTEIINGIEEELIHIFESFKKSSLLTLDIFDSEDDKHAYADLRNQVDRFLRSEKGEDDNSSDTASDNKEASKYEWNGGGVEVEPDSTDEDDDSTTSESDVESMNNDLTTSSDEIAATQESSVEEESSPNKEGIEEFKDLMDELKKKMNEKPSEALAFYRNNLKCYLVDDNIPMDTRDMLKSLEEKLIDKKYERYSKAREYMASQKGDRRRNKKRSGRK